ncbi:MAG: response regulator [Thermoanaerobaculia bacterium]
MKIRILIADDHPLVLSGLEHLFGGEADCEVVARCSHGEGILEAVRLHRPDVLILDSRMPGMESREVIRVLARERSPVRVVLHAEGSEEELIRDAVKLGVPGVILKEMPTATLLQCVRKVHQGGYWLERGAASRILEEMVSLEAGAREIAGLLTTRELETLKLLCRGLRNKEMACQLGISELTVKVHLRHISEKLHIKGRMALLRFAEDRGLSRPFRS